MATENRLVYVIDSEDDADGQVHLTVGVKRERLDDDGDTVKRLCVKKEENQDDDDDVVVDLNDDYEEAVKKEEDQEEFVVDVTFVDVDLNVAVDDSDSESDYDDFYYEDAENLLYELPPPVRAPADPLQIHVPCPPEDDIGKLTKERSSYGKDYTYTHSVDVSNTTTRTLRPRDGSVDYDLTPHDDTGVVRKLESGCLKIMTTVRQCRLINGYGHPDFDVRKCGRK
jgi:hypothetical protein